MEVAKEFQRINNQLKLHIVGSVARGEENPNDIDFVTNLALPNEKEVYHTKYDGYKIDIWRYPNVKIGKFMRTLDKGHLIAIYNGLKKNGYKLVDNGILNLETEKIIPFAVKKIFKLADIKYDPKFNYLML